MPIKMFFLILLILCCVSGCLCLPSSGSRRFTGSQAIPALRRFNEKGLPETLPYVHLMGQLENFSKLEQQSMLDLSSDFNRKERIWYYDEPPGPCWWRAPAPWELVLGGELQLCSLKGGNPGE